MPRTAAVAKAPKANSAAPVEKIIPLTGQALKAKLKELSNLTKTWLTDKTLTSPV
jgi:hypothetical protein